MKRLILPICLALLLSALLLARYFALANDNIRIVATQFQCARKMCSWIAEVENRGGATEHRMLNVYGGLKKRLYEAKSGMSAGHFQYEVTVGPFEEKHVDGISHFEKTPDNLDFKLSKPTRK